MTVNNAEEFKALGNKSFSAGDYATAISYFTKAIELTPDNHVLFSNRSACYASLKDYKNAKEDAEKTVSLKPDWAKGYSRKGAALHGLGDYINAAEAFKQGLLIEPDNALLKKGLQEVEQAMENESMGGLGQIFGPNMYAKMAANPKLAPYLADADVMSKLEQIRNNPNRMGEFLNDPKMMQIMMGLMGVDGRMATNDDELEKAKEEANADLEAREKAENDKKMEVEPEVEIDEEELKKKQKREKSDAEKALGNQKYKKRQFEEALKHYDDAWAADDTNVAVLTNKAAVLFEMNEFKECIATCEKAVDVGREVRADFKLIARALGRIGTSYFKLDDLNNAVKYFNKSLAEFRTADILDKLRETERLIETRAKEAYINPEISEQEREKGNVLFKESKFPEAVKCYTEAIKRNPSDPKNYSNRAACYSKLMALNEAEKDCDEAIRLDENFVKAYIRKAKVQFGKREYQKCLETCNTAMAKDSEHKHTQELQNQIQQAYYAMNSGPKTDQERQQALQNPEVQAILQDPAMQLILQQMQQDPSAIRDHMKNPMIAQKMQTLINAGVIQMR